MSSTKFLIRQLSRFLRFMPFFNLRLRDSAFAISKGTYHKNYQRSCYIHANLSGQITRETSTILCNKVQSRFFRFMSFLIWYFSFNIRHFKHCTNPTQISRVRQFSLMGYVAKPILGRKHVYVKLIVFHQRQTRDTIETNTIIL